MRPHLILLAYGQLAVPADIAERPVPNDVLGTFLSNLAYYGYMPDQPLLTALRALPSDALCTYWRELEPVLRERTLANRRIGDFVVYKNFPADVLQMGEAEYWLNQLCIYLGCPADWISSPVSRPPLAEDLQLKRLSLALPGAEAQIYATLVGQGTRWTAEQRTFAVTLHGWLGEQWLDVDAFSFKENGIQLTVDTFYQEGELTIRNATDVLRLAVGLGGGDISLRTPVAAFPHLTRPLRRLFVELIEASAYPEEDMALRPALWKRFLSILHPGEFKSAERTRAAYDKLYKGELKSFAAQVEAGLLKQDPAVLSLMATRPGDFARRFHKAFAVFGGAALEAFLPVLPALEDEALLRLARYVQTINTRKLLMVPPRGQWAKAQVVANTKAALPEEVIEQVSAAIHRTRAARLAAQYPAGLSLEPEAGLVRMPISAQELAPFGPGTRFPIPTEVTFIRTASYWQNTQRGTCWFDNSWNFFDAAWASKGVCCWNHERLDTAAVFSGDPVNSANSEGKAAQLIDLDLAELKALGVRYAVWSLLSYNNLPFSTVDEVAGLLLWGTDAQAGELIEPGRAQLVLPVKGASLVKYLAMVDIETREVIFLDANLRGSRQSAADNQGTLGEIIPAYLDYVSGIPTLADYFSAVPQAGEPLTREAALSGAWRQRAVTTGEAVN